MQKFSKKFERAIKIDFFKQLLFRFYSLKSLIPKIIRRSPIINESQNNPPFRKIQAEFKMLRIFPKMVQWYAEDIHEIRITPIKITNPNKSSAHLFIVLFIINDLKRFR